MAPLLETSPTLGIVPLFAELAPAELDEIERQTKLKRYRRQTVIIEAGDESQTLYLLLSGHAKAYVEDETGKELVLQELKPGDYFGELALLGGIQRTASVMSLTDCEVRLLPGGAFQRLLRSRPELAAHLIRHLAWRVAALTDQVRDLGLLSAYERIKKVLIEGATCVGDRWITPRMTQQGLADRAGCSREMVSRIIRDLRIGGYILCEDRRFIIQRELPPRW